MDDGTQTGAVVAGFANINHQPPHIKRVKEKEICVRTKTYFKIDSVSNGVLEPKRSTCLALLDWSCVRGGG